MTEEQSGGSVAADDDLRPTVERHTQDIAELRQDVGEIKRSQNELRDEVIGMRAEGKQWRASSDQQAETLRSSITSLTREMAVRNGVDQERNRQAEESNRQSQLRTEALKRLSIWVGILTAILGLLGTTLFSSQTFDTAFWGHFRTHPRIEAQANATPNH